ncbi:MAG: hypothetical protein WCB92_25025, partial [Mycobacterium sp.]
ENPAGPAGPADLAGHPGPGSRHYWGEQPLGDLHDQVSNLPSRDRILSQSPNISAPFFSADV